MLAQKSSLPNINVLKVNLLFFESSMVDLHKSGKLIIAIAVSIYIMRFTVFSFFIYPFTLSAN